MRARSLHRTIGIILLIPFFAWAITGLVFFIKPGYHDAYEILTVKTYPLGVAREITPDPDWREVRVLKTVLGEHLLARTDAGWVQLDPTTRQPRGAPTESDVVLLLKDAFSTNPQRYGEIQVIAGETATTNTGVEVTLDWNRMSLQQRGRDTQRIDLLYRIHYLQWTGVKTVDRVVGLAGLVLVLALTSLGALLAFKR
jgi:hypothetical protein